VELRRRAKLRENFESTRLLYVAATRARDRLILSGATQKLESIRQDSWLGRIWRELDLESQIKTGEGADSRVVQVSDGLEVVVSINSNDAPAPARLGTTLDAASPDKSFDLSANARSDLSANARSDLSASARSELSASARSDLSASARSEKLEPAA